MLRPIALLCCLLSAQAFLLPLPSSSSSASSSSATMRLHAKGFGASSTPKFNLRYGELPEEEDPAQRLARQKRWETEYLAYVKRNGAHLCALSWRGYQAEGRGGILAKYEAKDMGGQEEEALSEVDRLSGVPSMYVSLARWMESGDAAKAGPAQAERQDLQQILDRVVSYDPEKAFVVVFQAHGVMGADIVTPNIGPPEMARKLMKQEADVATQTIDVNGHEVLMDNE